MVTLNDVENKNILNDIFNNDIIVFEDIQGSKIWVNWDGKEFTINPKRVGGIKLLRVLYFEMSKYRKYNY